MVQVVAAVAISAAVAYAASALAPKPKPTAQELEITSSAYGDPIPNVYGDARLACRLIWSDGVKHVKYPKKGGGKGSLFGGNQTADATAPYILTANLAFGICAGPMQALMTIWANGNIIYDARGTAIDPDDGSKVGTGKYIVRFYQGTETQLQDPLIQSYTDAANGTGSTPAYRGMCYIVFEGMNLTEDFGNQIPNIHCEVTAVVTDTLPTQVLTSLASETFGLTISDVKTTLFDYTSDTMYVCTGSGVSVWDLIANEETEQFTFAQMIPGPRMPDGSYGAGGPANFGIQPYTDYFPGGSWALTPQGYLVMVNATLNRGFDSGDATYIVFDLNSLKFIYESALQNGSGGINGVAAVWEPGAIFGVVVANAASSIVNHYFLTMNINGEPYMFDPTPSPVNPVYPTGVFWEFPSSIVDAGDSFSAGAIPRVVVAYPQLLYTDIYMIPGQILGSTMGIYRIRCFPNNEIEATLQEVIDLNASFGLTASFDVGDFEWDSTDGGLIINLSGRLGSPQQVIFKWVDPALDAFNTVTLQAESGIMWFRTDISFGPVVGQGLVSGSGGTGLSYLIKNSYGFDDSSGAGRGVQLDTTNGQTVWDQNNTTVVNQNPSPTGSAGLMLAYDARTNSALMWDEVHGKYYRIFFGIIGSNVTTLDDIVADICTRCGLEDADFDVTALNIYDIAGYVVGHRTTGQAAIQQLQDFYFFDGVESDGKIKFVLQSGSSAASITQNDLGETKTSRGKSTNDDNYWKHVHKQEVDLPIQISVKTFDPARNLQYGEQTFRRVAAPVTTMNSKKVTTVEAPIVMGAAEAIQIAQQLLFNEWLRRDTYECTLGWKWMELDPTDIVTVTMNNGDVYTARVTKEVIGGDLSMSMMFEAQDDELYASSAVADSGGNLLTPARGTTTLSTSMVLFDIPYIRDSDELGVDTAFLYRGCILYGSGKWPGAEVYKSVDGGNTFQDNGGDSKAVFGATMQPLPPNNSPFMFQAAATITVFPFKGVTYTLSSSTMAGLDSGQNLALVGGEMIQFLNANLNADGSYTLTGMYRGLRGTDWLCNSHSVGELFVLLDETTLATDTYSPSILGQAWYYRAITYGAYLDTGGTQQLQLRGAVLRPYPVAHITNAPSGGDLVVSWVRRTRLGGGWYGLTGTVPLNEAAEAYVAYILSAANVPVFNINDPTTYIREVSGLSGPTFTYTAAQMTADGFTYGTDTLYLVVYQLSATVGYGFPSAVALTGLLSSNIAVPDYPIDTSVLTAPSAGLISSTGAGLVDTTVQGGAVWNNNTLTAAAAPDTPGLVYSDGTLLEPVTLVGATMSGNVLKVNSLWTSFDFAGGGAGWPAQILIPVGETVTIGASFANTQLIAGQAPAGTVDVAVSVIHSGTTTAVGNLIYTPTGNSLGTSTLITLDPGDCIMLVPSTTLDSLATDLAGAICLGRVGGGI